MTIYQPFHLETSRVEYHFWDLEEQSTSLLLCVITLGPGSYAFGVSWLDAQLWF